jgi:hypothetical protein
MTQTKFASTASILRRAFVLALEFLLTLRRFVQAAAGQAFLLAGAGDFPVASAAFT